MARLLVVAVAIALLAAACGSDSGDLGSAVATQSPEPTDAPATTTSSLEEDQPATLTPAPTLSDAVTATRLVPEVVAAFPHDTGAWTQGLIGFGERMFESTGATDAVGTLREVDLGSGEIIRLIEVAQPLYPEGLERVDDRLIQLTWQDQVAFVYDLETFEQIGAFSYEGEGWGLCLDGARLVMSDGSDQLQFRDPITFEEIAPRAFVTLDGQPLPNLNELECVEGTVWANVWQTDTIVEIDPTTGVVTSVVDAASLERPPEANVLNGIAFDPASGNFLVTGKWWPTIYEVRFVLAG